MNAIKMRRRDLVALIIGAAIAWPLAGHAQQPERLRRVGVLMPFREDDAMAKAFLTALEQALGRLGWVEDKNIRIDKRFAASDSPLFKTYAAELVGLAPDVMLADTPVAVAALRQQAQTIPIVFVLMIDPVGQGFVQSLARPGGNITGFAAHDAQLMGKWLELRRSRRRSPGSL